MGTRSELALPEVFYPPLSALGLVENLFMRSCPGTRSLKRQS